MWGIIPAAGRGSRIQPLAFSKELLPVGSRRHGTGERPCAVSEYIVERMILGGADKLCFVISPGKSDIMEYFGASYGPATITYMVQPRPVGLCDAVFRPLPLIAPGESVVVGLPDTVWFPEGALAELPDDVLAFLLFPVERPELFDAVELDSRGRVRAIHVKQAEVRSHWIWGAFKMPGHVFHALTELWRDPDRGDEYIGTLVNAYLARGGVAVGIKAGHAYFDVGTMHGYRNAVSLLSDAAAQRTEGGAVGEPLAARLSAPAAG